ncbi:MAG TPA: YheC/YheD family protein [Alicyclobacillus sp.]|nr:YheC/YheD family protein [Alicyclobacillus sp.]
MGHADSVIVTLPLPWARELGIAPGEMTQLRFGHWRGPAQVDYARNPGNSVEVIWNWPDTQERIPIPSHHKPRQVRGVLDLGPVLAVLIGAKAKDVGHRRIPRWAPSLFRAGNQKGMPVYVCYADEIDWQYGRVRGGRRWRPGTGVDWQWWPLPDVIYNRVPHRWEEDLAPVKQVKTEAEQRGIAVFNSGFLDKWSTFRILHRVSHLRRFLPRTERMGDPGAIGAWVRAGRAFFAKPVHGSLGEGLVFCEPHPDGWRVGTQQEGRVQRAVVSQERLIHKLTALTSRRAYLLQEKIELKTYHGRKVDFRVHLQKDRHGRWRMVAAAGKGAHPEALSTHVRFGGTVWPAEEILSHWFAHDSDTWLNRFSDVGCAVARSLERVVGGNFGEMGLDMGICTEGRLWMFEVNAKPGHHIFHHPELKGRRTQWAQMVIDYASRWSRSPRGMTE